MGCWRKQRLVLPQGLVLESSSHFAHGGGRLHLAGGHKLVVATFICSYFPADVQVEDVAVRAAAGSRVGVVLLFSSYMEEQRISEGFPEAPAFRLMVKTEVPSSILLLKHSFTNPFQNKSIFEEPDVHVKGLRTGGGERRQVDGDVVLLAGQSAAVALQVVPVTGVLRHPLHLVTAVLVGRHLGGAAL